MIQWWIYYPYNIHNLSFIPQKKIITQFTLQCCGPYYQWHKYKSISIFFPSTPTIFSCMLLSKYRKQINHCIQNNTILSLSAVSRQQYHLPVTHNYPLLQLFSNHLSDTMDAHTLVYSQFTHIIETRVYSIHINIFSIEELDSEYQIKLTNTDWASLLLSSYQWFRFLWWLHSQLLNLLRDNIPLQYHCAAVLSASLLYFCT